MAVVIRLSRRGAPKRPFYRIIVSPKGTKRDSKFIEVVGTYNPMTNPPTVELKTERVQYWVEKGAQPSEVVGTIIKKNIPNFLEPRLEHKRKKIQAARKKRKARVAKKK
ncbi:MAG: 30S ribosomal protein S16 [Proteobacteria bacterium]|nr:30S ribosomal protein S16 [Pseudomonadota bacterium]